MLASLTTWHGWDWHFWDPLVAVGTLALAGATIHLAVSTKRLATQTAEEIRESHRVRRADAERRRIERVYDETIRVVEALRRAQRAIPVSTTHYDDIDIAQERLGAAILVAGGPERWVQTDLLTREIGGDLDVNALVRQATGALREIGEAAEAAEVRDDWYQSEKLGPRPTIRTRTPVDP